MNIKDDELQQKIENGEFPIGNELDVRAYQEVFHALSKEPALNLSASFADKIVSKVIEKKKHSEARDFLWFGIGLFFLLITFVVALVMTAPNLHLGFLKNMSGYAGLFVFGVAILIAFNWMDRRIIRKEQEV
jgi:hypothetical protein